MASFHCFGHKTQISSIFCNYWQTCQTWAISLPWTSQTFSQSFLVQVAYPELSTYNNLIYAGVSIYCRPTRLFTGCADWSAPRVFFPEEVPLGPCIFYWLCSQVSKISSRLLCTVVLWLFDLRSSLSSSWWLTGGLLITWQVFRQAITTLRLFPVLRVVSGFCYAILYSVSLMHPQMGTCWQEELYILVN